MKTRWLTHTLLATLLISLTGCDLKEEPSAAKPKESGGFPAGSFEPLAIKAWQMMNAHRYEESLAFVDMEFAKIEVKAREQEKSLTFFPKMTSNYKYHELDGAANLLFVKQEVLERQGKTDEAAKVWEIMVSNFPHAQGWGRPNVKWRLGRDARTEWQQYTLMKAIKERKLDTYKYATDTIFDLNVKARAVTEVGKKLIADKDFDGLEYACGFFTTNPKWQHIAESDISRYLIAPEVDETEKNPDAPWQERKEHIEHWIKAKPESVWAPVGLASFWIQYAWFARGGGWSNTVTEVGWHKFHGRIKTAHDILDAAKRDCPAWYSRRLTVCMAESAEPTEVNTIFMEGINKYPWFQPISTQMTTILLPRWLGKPGDWQGFAAMMGKELGPTTYLQICLSAAGAEGREEVGVDKSVDWTLMKAGFEQQIKETPNDLWLKNTYAAYAWLRKDQAAGKRAFMLINNVPHPYVWDTEAGFLDVKRWAEK